MPSSKTYANVSTALPALLERVLTDGLPQGSRNGAMRELTMAQVTLREPTRRYITTPGRRASLPAQIAETMWLLAGRDDIAWLSNYLPRAADFSDDGVTWRGAYGPRLRRWTSARPATEAEQRESIYAVRTETDQLAHVVELLKADPETRRAVLSIYDPVRDTSPGKDIPCNNWIHLLPRDGELHGHVAIRSNDLMWGWSGINAFEWSALLEIVAGLVGLRVGKLTFSISSLHLYERHYEKGWKIIGEADRAQIERHREGPRFDANRRTVAGLDQLVDQWFRVENMIRTEPRGSAWRYIESFPEPMLKSWLQVLYVWWHGLQDEWEARTDLDHALKASPRRPGTASPEQLVPDAEQAAAAQVAEQVAVPRGPSVLRDPAAGEQAFKDFVVELHADKDKAYGNSWKRRGEQVAILANMARKVDRLAVEGGGDSAADTVIDLLVYAVKYRLWIAEYMDAPVPAAIAGGWDLNGLSDDPLYVESMVQALDPGQHWRGMTDDVLTHQLRQTFDALERIVQQPSPGELRHNYVDPIIQMACVLGGRLWVREQMADELAQAPLKVMLGSNASEADQRTVLGLLDRVPDVANGTPDASPTGPHMHVQPRTEGKPSHLSALGHGERNATRSWKGYGE